MRAGEWTCGGGPALRPPISRATRSSSRHRLPGRAAPRRRVGEYGDALNTLEQALGVNHYEVGSALVGLGALEQQHDPDLAEQHYVRALAIKLRTRGPRHPEVGIIHNNLGALYRAQGRDDLAREHFRAAARRLRRYGPDHPAVRTCQANITALLATGP